MDKVAALEALATVLRDYRGLPYEILVSRIDEVDARQVRGATGVEYNIEVQVFWDDRPQQDVRVLGSVDDGGLSAWLPLCDGFIMSPQGAFVGEGEG